MRSAPPACAQRSRGGWVTPMNEWSGTRSRACCMIWDGRASIRSCSARSGPGPGRTAFPPGPVNGARSIRSEEHTSELQSRLHLVCRLLLEKKKKSTLYSKRVQESMHDVTEADQTRC